jgi:hypothetical protein
MKNSNDTIEHNRTRDLPACSAVSQPTAPPRAPSCYLYFVQDVLFVSSDSVSHACKSSPKTELHVTQRRNQYVWICDAT